MPTEIVFNDLTGEDINEYFKEVFTSEEGKNQSEKNCSMPSLHVPSLMPRAHRQKMHLRQTTDV